jgi:hypothetical protein
MALFGRTQVVVIESLFPVTTLIQLEASVSESHRRVAEVTEHPVEAGADVSDHIRFKARELDITGIVSNTPIQLLASLTSLPSVPGGDPSSRAEDAFLELERIMESGSLCLIATTLFQYEGMALVSLSTPRDAARGNVAELQMTWREVRLAETLKIAAPVPLSPSRSVTAELGRQSAKVAKAASAAQSQSALLALLGLL